MDPLFSPDCPVFIIGGGSSLRDFDWKRLDGWPCIAVNTAFRTVPRADVFFFGDDRFFDWHKDPGDRHFWRFQGGRIMTTAARFADGTIAADKRPIEYVDPKSLTIGKGKKGLNCAGMNSGAKAIALAHQLGAEKIVLLGFDNKPGHWHDGTIYGHRLGTAPTAYTTYAADMSKIAKALPGAITNAGPDSALTCFPAVSLDDLIP